MIHTRQFVAHVDALPAYVDPEQTADAVRSWAQDRPDECWNLCVYLSVAAGARALTVAKIVEEGEADAAAKELMPLAAEIRRVADLGEGSGSRLIIRKVTRPGKWTKQHVLESEDWPVIGIVR